jgi:pimeloyl-ACP methyl ester carboxylesterase
VEKDHAEFITNFILDLFAVENVSKYHGEITKLKASALKTSKKRIIAALRGMKNRDDSTEFLQTLNKPVLFISGKQDKRIPIETLMQQAANPPHAEILLLENVGHMGFIEAEHKTMIVLSDFAKHV